VNSQLNRKFLKLEESRLVLIERLKNISQSKLEASPSPGKWSVSQIWYHLNRAESLSVLYVSKKRLDINNLKRTGFGEQFKMAMLKFRFIITWGIRAPVNVLGDVPEKVAYNIIVSQWNETRTNLKSLLESLPDELLYKNVFKQPAIGRVNIFQMIDFMQAHFDRHRKQVEHIINQK